MRPGVEQVRQRLGAQRPGRKIGHAPPGIGNAAWATARVAGASLGEPPVRIPRERRKWIRTNRLRFLHSGARKQETTGRIRRIGNHFRHRRGARSNKVQAVWLPYVSSLGGGSVLFYTSALGSRPPAPIS